MLQMRILGIETSCDETAAAVVEMNYGKLQVLSNVVSSQVDLHKEFGGVVPEVAARSHIEIILPIVEKALSRAFSEERRKKKEENSRTPYSVLRYSQFDPWDQIDGIAVTYGPGLPGAVLVGTTTARALALFKNKPLYAVNHVEGHVYANWLLPTTPVFPVLALIVSGLHSQLVLFQDHFKYNLLGQTQDDAVGEAFDKVSRMLGMGYPGGRAVAEAAKHGDVYKYTFPKARLEGLYDFSFSGLKTAVLRHLQKLVGKDSSASWRIPSYTIAPLLSKQQVNDTAASFQRVAIETLVEVTLKAYEEFLPKTVVIGGGVASNRELRKLLRKQLPVKINYAPAKLCTDNAAMIAALGCFVAKDKKAADPLKLETVPSLSM